jgi:hypothetical protein
VTLIDVGIPGVTLTDEIQLSDYKRKWNFIFQSSCMVVRKNAGQPRVGIW